MLFLLSVPAQLKSALLNAATLLLYTPSNEHFGIVPLEAMLAGVPVLAANSGGPLETITDSETGWLRPVDKVEQWTEVMYQVLHEKSDFELRQIGDNGKRRVREEFSKTKLARRLEEELEAMLKARRVQATELGDVALSIPILGACLVSIGAIVKVGMTDTQLHYPEIALGAVLITLCSIGIFVVIYKLLQNESAFM